MKREVIRNNELDYDDDTNVDFELMSHTQLVGPNVGLIPLQNAVQPTRVFYGARFANQAQPVVNNEAPLVQALDEGDTSYDEKLGVKAGAIRAKSDGIIEDVTDDHIRLRRADGQSEDIPLFKHYPFNRYSGLTQKSVVQKGQQVRASDTLARSNFTDDKGALALGLNARIGLVPYKGFSMDDAIVVSEDFAKRATSQHMDMLVTELGKNGVQGGRDHFVSLFPDEFTRDQLDKLDEHGLIKPGTMLSKGDPLVLATRPRNMNSSQAQAIGRLSRQARSLRANASNIWEQESPGVVTDVVRKNDGTVKVLVEYAKPLELGDKLALRSGNKNIVSKIIPSAQMPRTADGQPLEVLLNHQGIPSRANPSLVLELLLGKVAAKTGKPIKLPAFNKTDDSWVDFARQKLAELKLTDKEDVFDPTSGRKLVKPITVGNGYILKLHHVASHKLSARGQAGYDQDGLPMKGGQAGGGAKRRSGLEVAGMLSSGAYANLRENMTLSGTMNDQFWRDLRAGNSPKPPGAPFVWTKFRALLQGSGVNTRDLGDGRLRLAMFTDKDLEDNKPLPIANGELVDFSTLTPKKGGLFDESLVAGNRWGYIDLPEPMPQPAAEDTIRRLLGLTKKEFEQIIAGETLSPQV